MTQNLSIKGKHKILEYNAPCSKMATDSLYCKIFILIGPHDLLSKHSIQSVIDLSFKRSC